MKHGDQPKKSSKDEPPPPPPKADFSGVNEPTVYFTQSTIEQVANELKQQLDKDDGLSSQVIHLRTRIIFPPDSRGF